MRPNALRTVAHELLELEVGAREARVILSGVPADLFDRWAELAENRQIRLRDATLADMRPGETYYQAMARRAGVRPIEGE